MREILPPYSRQDDIMRKVIAFVFVSFVPHRAAQKLRHRLRRYALQREVRSHSLLEGGIGAEHDLVPHDHR